MLYVVDEKDEISIKEAAELVVEAMDFGGDVIVSIFIHFICTYLFSLVMQSFKSILNFCLILVISTTQRDQMVSIKKLLAMQNFANTYQNSNLHQLRKASIFR